MHGLNVMNLVKNYMTRIENTKYVIISLIAYFCMTQFVYVVVPVRYLADHLVSHTILFVLILVVIYMLGLVYDTKDANVVGSKKLILYSTAGIILCIVINFPYGIWVNSSIAKPKEYALFLNYGTISKLYFLVMLCIVGPIIEEIYCRRYIFNMIKSDFSVSTGVILSSFIYMILHGLRIDFIHLFIPGVIYALVYEKTKSIWSSIVVHCFNNVIWFSLVYFA